MPALSQVIFLGEFSFEAFQMAILILRVTEILKSISKSIIIIAILLVNKIIKNKIKKKVDLSRSILNSTSAVQNIQLTIGFKVNGLFDQSYFVIAIGCFTSDLYCQFVRR